MRFGYCGIFSALGGCVGGSSVGWVFGLVSGAWVLLCLSLG